MISCSNCQKAVVGLEQRTLRVFQGAKLVGVICRACQEGVSVAKVVLARDAGREEFAYEGYLPAERLGTT